MSTIIQDLQDPGALPDRTEKVSLVQTHISLVFVADLFVYKVKKPVDFGFLDFSTLKKREYYCHREVELNRRLSSGIYIDVLPVTLHRGKFTLRETGGEAVDYAVRMRRIPEDRLMKSLFFRNEITRDHLKSVARVLADFHSRASRNPEIDRFGEPEVFKVNTDENFQQVEKYVGITISEDQLSSIKGWTENFYSANRDLFLERIKKGRIRDCHGDLHMEHICLTYGTPIFDCIEFNDRFRYSDTVADLAFLLMDLEYHGGKDLAKVLWEEYRAFSKEEDVDMLLGFYKVYRAFVRGKVNGFQVDDPSILPEKREEAANRARKYFELAHRYVRELGD
ncbi:MAG TPA: gluconokinase [Deltaproteobacteria bacterium]|nr:gluconokinase [Deltaproteobacteria bacterium]